MALRPSAPRGGDYMLWCCIKMLGREYRRRASPLADLPQRSPQVVYMAADLLHFGPDAPPPGARPRDHRAFWRGASLPPAGGAAAPTPRSGRESLVASPCALASMISRGWLRLAHIYPLPQYVDSPSPTTRSLVRRSRPVRAGAIQLSGYVLLRISLPRTPMHRCSSSAGLATGSRARCADEHGQQRAYVRGSTVAEVPSTRPERSLARTATYRSVVWTTIAVSKPSRGTELKGSS